MSKRIVAVTGANRGLGLALATRLLAGTNYDKVILCVRDIKKGQEALKSIKDSPAPDRVELAQLDMSSQKSIESFGDWIQKNNLPLTALVNNAGILLNSPKQSAQEKIEQSMQTNLFGIIHLNNLLLDKDLIQDQGKIVNISSKLANSSFIRDEDLKKRVQNLKSIEEIREFYNWILKTTTTPEYKNFYSNKFPYPEYGLSKLLLSKYTSYLAKDPRVIEKQLEVYSLCPGWCKTDMGGQMATDSVESGTNLSHFLLTEQKGINPSLQGRLVVKPDRAMDIN